MRTWLAFRCWIGWHDTRGGMFYDEVRHCMAALTLLDARVTVAQQKRPTPEQVAAYQYGEWPGER